MNAFIKPADFVARLVTAAADFSGLDEMQILSKSRSMELCEARWACFIALHSKGWTLQRIGRAFRLGHDTVIHGLLRAKDDHGNRDQYFRELCRVVRQSLEIS